MGISKPYFLARSGSSLAILGPNGSKSTILKILSGEIKQTSGSVSFRGKRLQVPLHRRVQLGIGFLPQVSSGFGVKCA